MFIFRKPIFICLILLQQIHGTVHLDANDLAINPVPASIIPNPCPQYTLINSVDFHPNENLFCITYTQGNQVNLYRFNASGQPELYQSLSNPSAKLREPQHAAFSPNGKTIAVANSTNQTLTFYQKEKNDLFSPTPSSIIYSPNQLRNHKPHGITFSPCGNFLAIAYGASNSFSRGIALFHIIEDGKECKLVALLDGSKELPGIPKGIAFSPDGTCLLVTFADKNSLAIFGWSAKESDHPSNPIASHSRSRNWNLSSRRHKNLP